ncbi:hypothetical protein D0869_07598 [Hortaea werneckii]|uniref:Elongin-C n=1 Tax=Hortaea werneckii TaxID=91943 RepID=A0A3M6WQ58_HORWE|nr:hypothetical protein D0869_07598 [Hortaea werneckii]
MASGSSETDYVTLISNDGFSFVVQRSAATISPMVRKMLDPQTPPFPFPALHHCLSPFSSPHLFHIPHSFLSAQSTHHVHTLTQRHAIKKSGIVLEKVCEYFYYNERNRDARDVPDMDFPTELCLEILMAADYLGGV